jgi:hypothetical protein
MKITGQLPQEWQHVAALDARVASGNLSLEDLQQISDELVPLLYSTSTRVQKAAKEIFEFLAALKQGMVERDVHLVAQLQALDARVELLWLQMGDLSPEEVAEELTSLDKEFLSLSIPSASRLREKYKSLGMEIERLQFCFVFPVVSELDDGEQTFAREMFRLAERVRNEQSPKALDELTATQKKEILQLAGQGQGMSAEGLSHAMEEYVEALRVQSRAAQSFFAGRVDEGFQALLDLPEEVRIQVDEQVEEAAGGSLVDPTLPEGYTLIAAAILQSMEERMGFSD